MQLAGGVGDGVAVLTVDVVVTVVAADAAGIRAAEVAPDDDVVDDGDVVVVVLHHTGPGLDTEMVAEPACAASKLACMVPSAS